MEQQKKEEKKTKINRGECGTSPDMIINIAGRKTTKKQNLTLCESSNVSVYTLYMFS